MRIAFISDIHSNYDALLPVLAYIRQVEAAHIYCAGDIVGYGAQPNECIDALRDAGAVCVMGNHEAFLLNCIEEERLAGAAGEAIEWQKKVITKENIKFLEKLPVTLTLEGQSILLTHGSPFEPELYSYVIGERATIMAFESFYEQICIIGHTHTPIAYKRNAKYRYHEEILDDVVQIENGYKYIINVGSVGQPRDGHPEACVYIYDTEEKVFIRKRIEYNVSSAQKRIKDAKLPAYLALRLRSGD